MRGRGHRHPHRDGHRGRSVAALINQHLVDPRYAQVSTIRADKGKLLPG
ncbi:hypothetical protein W823_05820 [Williamsia sp. D3]|nr:hypothetical protein W823_05820 [Williamsia sp. D3]